MQQAVNWSRQRVSPENKNMSSQTIPFIDLGGSGENLHFLHANGYPPACYHPLLERLSKRQHVTAMLMRPLWDGQKPEDLNDWLPLSQDLLQFFDQQHTGKWVGVGHSIGATVTLRAAIRQPERFRALILLDPAFFRPHFILFWKLIKSLGLGYQLHPLIPAARRRRREFDDLEKLFSAYRRRKIFRYVDDDSLRAYIHGITRPAAGGGYELVYSPDWETRIYYTGLSPDLDLWRGLPGLKIPILIVRGAETDTFVESTARHVQRVRPETNILTLQQSTHLLPIERPQALFETISTFLDSL